MVSTPPPSARAATMAATRSLSMSSVIVLVPFDDGRNNDDAEDACEDHQPPKPCVHWILLSSRGSFDPRLRVRMPTAAQRCGLINSSLVSARSFETCAGVIVGVEELDRFPFATLCMQ